MSLMSLFVAKPLFFDTSDAVLMVASQVCGWGICHIYVLPLLFLLLLFLPVVFCGWTHPRASPMQKVSRPEFLDFTTCWRDQFYGNQQPKYKGFN